MELLTIVAINCGLEKAKGLCVCDHWSAISNKKFSGLTPLAAVFLFVHFSKELQQQLCKFS